MKVFVTGIGPMLPCLPGKAGLDAFHPSELERAGGEGWFDPDVQLGPRGHKYLGQAARYLFASARQLSAEAPSGAGPEGVLVGSNTCARRVQDEFDESLLREGYLGIHPMRAPDFCSNMGAGGLAARHQAKAFSITLMTPVTAGLDAVILAAQAIRAGRAASAIAGAAEDDSRLSYSGGYTTRIRGGAWTLRLQGAPDPDSATPAFAALGPAANGFLPAGDGGADSAAEERMQRRLDPLFAGGAAAVGIASLGDAGSARACERLVRLLERRGIGPRGIQRNAGETGYATLQALAHLSWLGLNAPAAVCFALGPAGHWSAVRITREE